MQPAQPTWKSIHAKTPTHVAKKNIGAIRFGRLAFITCLLSCEDIWSDGALADVL
jgi:hypothetical protein